MCAPDPNEGIRMQAKIEHQKKMGQYQSESLKYWNRETSYKRGRQRIAGGLSRARSDVHVKALHVLGESRKQQAAYEIAKMQLPSRYNDYKAGEATTSSGVSRARGYGRQKYMEILSKQAEIESSIDTTFGRNMDANHQKINRYNRMAQSRNRERLGVRPEYGAPVFMPPKGDTTMANIGMMLQLAGTAAGAMASDIRLKENINQVGKSPEGYKIYEWNYKADKNTRYRGVTAQDVMKINPMAVDILPNGYLGVYYDQIDVPMEVV